MFKVDDRKNRLTHEICLKLTIKTPERNRKNKNITVNKHMFKVASLTTDFEYVYLYLVKIVFITLEISIYFQIIQISKSTETHMDASNVKL